MAFVAVNSALFFFYYCGQGSIILLETLARAYQIQQGATTFDKKVWSNTNVGFVDARACRDIIVRFDEPGKPYRKQGVASSSRMYSYISHYA